MYQYKPHWNLQEDSKVWYKDLLNMEIPEWIISRFDVKVKSANLDTILKEEFNEMIFNLKVKSVYTFKEIEYYLMNEWMQNIPNFVQLLSVFY